MISAILVADVVESRTQATAYSVTSVDVVTGGRDSFDVCVGEQGRRARWRQCECGIMETREEGRDVAVKGSDNPRNTALFSCRLVSERWGDLHAAAEQLVGDMGWSCAGANQVWSLIGSGLASERCGGAIPSFRRAHPGLPCSGSRPVTEANFQSITRSELRRACVRVIAPWSKTRCCSGLNVWGADAALRCPSQRWP